MSFVPAAGRPCHVLAILGLVVSAGALCDLAAAPESQEPPPESGSPAPEPVPPSVEEPPAGTEPQPHEAEGESIHPDAVSPFLTRVYDIKPKKLWKVLLEEFEAAGFPPEEVDQERRAVKTSFVDWKQDDYVEPVADFPPRFGAGYNILQIIRIKEGKTSLEAIVTSHPQGTELRVRARLLVQGLDRKRGIRVMTDRRSAGAIEARFLLRLQTRLGLKPIF